MPLFKRLTPNVSRPGENVLGRTFHLIKLAVTGSGNHCYHRPPARTYYTCYMEPTITMFFI